MPPKKTTTREMILKAAVEILEENGMSELSSRNLAKRLSCSISPIFTSFKNMAELEEEAMRIVGDLLVEYSTRDYTDNIFLNQGIGIVLFARDHKLLYQEMVAHNDRFSKVMAEVDEKMQKQSMQDPNVTSFSKETALDLRIKMWIFSTGLSALINTGQMENDSIEYITKILFETGRAVIIDLRNFGDSNENGYPVIKEQYREKVIK